VKKKIYIMINLVLILALAFPTIAFGQNPAPTTPPDSGTATGEIPDETSFPEQKFAEPEELPQEVLDFFKDGVTIEEYLAFTGGTIPEAIKDYVSDEMVTVVVEMEAPPLADHFAKSMNTEGVSTMNPLDQRDYIQQVESAQQPVVNSIENAMEGNVISQYQKAYNGLLVTVPASQLDAIKALPGVKAIHHAPSYHPTLIKSVPLIKANQVWASSGGYTGNGVTVAVIDTGIDYTHAALGGSGNVDDYKNNDFTSTTDIAFPTAKVIGGYDFAGTDYTGKNLPHPDPDPLDEMGHGTHVASTIAGVAVNNPVGAIGPGVAPQAKLYAFKIFGKDGSTSLTLNGIEAAVDPNGDGDLSDHVDVINMSLGSDFGPNDPDDPTAFAVNYASSLGIVVVASAGNAGNNNYITGNPASADSAISVAASTTGFATNPTLSISGTAALTLTGIAYQPGNFDDHTGHFTSTVTGTLQYVGAYTTSKTLCSTRGITNTAVFSHSVALIQRGACSFATKVNNAKSLGADAAIIFNHATGGDSKINMGGSTVHIPAGFIGHTDGMHLTTQNGQTVVILDENKVTIFPDSKPADTIASFSSRGPRSFDSVLKPEISAPGVNIFAAKMGSGKYGVSKSGTSMAAPHIAGVAALLKQEHPDWTAEMIKAAMMNTAVDLADATSREVPRQGAGRVDALAASKTDTLVIADRDLVSLNWGFFTTGNKTYSRNKSITLQKVGPLTATPTTYNISWAFGEHSLTAGFTMTLPTTVTVPKVTTRRGRRSIVKIPVTMIFDATKAETKFKNMEEYYGYIKFTPQGAPTTTVQTLRIPFYAVPRPHAELTLTQKQKKLWKITNTGAYTSSLLSFPVFYADENDTDVNDYCDLRYVGMDYAFHSSRRGDFIAVALNTYGSITTPQPYLCKFELSIDNNQDGHTDYVDFNSNEDHLFKGIHFNNNKWMIARYKVSNHRIYLASPYYISTDFNSGFQIWLLPTNWNGASASDKDFKFKINSFDKVQGTEDTSNSWWYFDAAHPPVTNSVYGNPGPGKNAYLVVSKIDTSVMSPLGVMVADKNGKPGEGQAYFLSNSQLAYRGVKVSPATAVKGGPPGSDVTFNMTITNTGNITGTYAISVTGDWTTTLSASTVSINTRASKVVTVTVSVPPNTPAATSKNFALAVTSNADTTIKVDAALTVKSRWYNRFFPFAVKKFTP